MLIICSHKKRHKKRTRYSYATINNVGAHKERSVGEDISPNIHKETVRLWHGPMLTTSLSAKFCSEVPFTNECAIYQSSCMTNVVSLAKLNPISQHSQNTTLNTWCCGLVQWQLPWLAHIFFTGLLKSPHMEQCWICSSHQSWDPDECWMTCGCSMMTPHPLQLSCLQHFEQTFSCTNNTAPVQLRYYDSWQCSIEAPSNNTLLHTDLLQWKAAPSCGRLSPSLLHRWTVLLAWWPTYGWTLHVKT